jgi:hypothetical protein
MIRDMAFRLLVSLLSFFFFSFFSFFLCMLAIALAAVQRDTRFVHHTTHLIALVYLYTVACASWNVANAMSKGVVSCFVWLLTLEIDVPLSNCV